METLEQIKSRITHALPGARLEIIPNDSPSGQHTLLVDTGNGVAVAKFLRDDTELHLDYCSNATGVDWPEAVVKTKIKKQMMVEGVEKEVEETIETLRSGCLEAVYHLFSMAKKHGPVILRLRTENRSDKNHLPSLTPVWRSCEFQEREIFDLYGIVFDGHPDLRRILMWDGFKDFPMRKDYVGPDDYDYEPTPHDDVLEKVKQHAAAEVKA
jgi:NADH-quinone oxidoreductase subunit C